MYALRRGDLDFLSEYDAAARRGAPRGTVVSLLVFAGMFLVALVWASWAKLDEVTRGLGQVIPSSKTQLIQSLEGGIVKEILVRAGDRVAKGAVLVRIDDTGFSSNLGESRAKQLALQSQVARLRHEAEGALDVEPPFTDELHKAAPDIIANELELFRARRLSLDTQLRVLQERIEQRTLELSEVNASLKRFNDNLKLAEEDMKIKKPLADRGIVAKTDVLKIRRDIADTSGQIATAQETKSRTEAAIREAKAMFDEQEQKFRQDARAELSQGMAELTVIEETLRAAKDRVVRADIRSPVEGIVNKLNTNTVGGVVQAGQTLMEIVPLEDSLFVEAKIRPSDIAFVHPRQPAVVKITAYDFSVYGGLEGEVELISPDSIYDEQARESYYIVTVKTLQSQLKGKEGDLPIIPGMVASVDILTGKKSVLDYLLKPINKARSEALTER
ncbi:HlyD family type I secretion periplasmic adaptor subunit [Taklimakanibacter deserti]|uniref:HlyD family type I secretion periplasmic adaptor subunit n=1 Tax=Taklimakanibacter deserti TaxID=2267839 RepID=UPI000E649149